MLLSIKNSNRKSNFEKKNTTMAISKRGMPRIFLFYILLQIKKFDQKFLQNSYGKLTVNTHLKAHKRIFGGSLYRRISLQ
jgi:hypothetical protein